METTSLLTRQDIPTPPQASSAWIAPNGDFYYVRSSNHNYCAALIIGADPDEVWNADTLLDARGWVHLSNRDIYVKGGQVTQAQRDTLWDVAQAYLAMGFGVTYEELLAQMEELD